MGIAERKEREREQRRNDIIDAAESVFFSKGIDLATMDEVAEAAELSKGTLYLYFKSKMELYMAVSERGMALLADMFEDVLRGPGKGHDKLRNIGLAYFEFAKKYPDYYKASFHFETHDMDGGILESEVAHGCVAKGERLFDQTVAAITQGIKDGSIHSEQNPRELAVMLWSSMRGIIQLYNLKHRGHHLAILSDLDLNDLAPHFINLVMEGIRPAPEATFKEA